LAASPSSWIVNSGIWILYLVQIRPTALKTNIFLVVEHVLLFMVVLGSLREITNPEMLKKPFLMQYCWEWCTVIEMKYKLLHGYWATLAAKLFIKLNLKLELGPVKVPLTSGSHPVLPHHLASPTAPAYLFVLYEVHYK